MTKASSGDNDLVVEEVRPLQSCSSSRGEDGQREASSSFQQQGNSCSSSPTTSSSSSKSATDESNTHKFAPWVVEKMTREVDIHSIFQSMKEGLDGLNARLTSLQELDPHWEPTQIARLKTNITAFENEIFSLKMKRFEAQYRPLQRLLQEEQQANPSTTATGKRTRREEGDDDDAVGDRTYVAQTKASGQSVSSLDELVP